MKPWAYVTLPLVGALALYVIAWPTDPVSYPVVIVPAARIIEREPDTVRTIVERIRFVEVAPIQIARAPGGGLSEVTAFCRPQVIIATRDTTAPDPPRRTLIRSVVHTPSIIPLRRDGLFVSAVTSDGDLEGWDYGVRPGWRARAGDGVSVTYPRFAPGRELVEGAVWYGAFRGLEALLFAVLR